MKMVPPGVTRRKLSVLNALKTACRAFSGQLPTTSLRQEVIAGFGRILFKTLSMVELNRREVRKS